MKKSGYIIILALLFLGVAKLLDVSLPIINKSFWEFAGLEKPHGFIEQGLIFLALLYVLQNFLFAPYLRVMEEREAQTIGKSATAEKTRVEAEEKLRSYRQRIEDARLAATRERERQGMKSDEEEQAKLLNAKDEAKRKLDASLGQIGAEARSAREELRSSVDVVTNEIVSHVLSGTSTKSSVRKELGMAWKNPT